MRYVAVYKASQKGLRITYLTKAAGVSRSGYGYWLRHRQDKVAKDENSLALIRKVFEGGHRKIGIRRIAMILRRKHSAVMNLKKIGRIKRQYDLRTVIRRKRPHILRMQQGLESRMAENLLCRDFAQTKPDKVYSTDISYLEYRNGRAFLSATKDLATKEIVAHNVSGNLGLNAASLGLEKRLHRLKRSQRAGLMVHSDQGHHYTNAHYVELLKRHGVTQSMSRKGNCLDNAPIESFFGHLKDELELKRCESLAQVREEVAKYIRYYNNERSQWALKKMTPTEYRRHLLKARC